MANIAFDFWHQIPVPENSTACQTYAIRHAGIVDYWFEEQAPSFFNCYDCYVIYGYLSFPYAIYPQYGPMYNWVWTGFGFVKKYWYLERRDAVMTTRTMFDNFGANLDEYKGCDLINDTGNPNYGFPNSLSCQ